MNAPDKAVLTWVAFGSGSSSFGSTEQINYFLPSASSSILNTVSGGVASTIGGQISSIGNVYILNPAGIIIDKTARIDVGGFYASTVAEPTGFFSIEGKLSFAGTSTNSIVVVGTGSTSGVDAATIQAVGTGNNIYLAANAVNVQGGKFYGNLFVKSSSTTANPLTSATNPLLNDANASGVNTSFGSTGPVSINTVGASALGGGLNVTTNGGNIALTGGVLALATSSVAAGAVTAVTPSNTGTVYGTTAGVSVPTVTFSGGGGTGATATATINASGNITGYTVTAGGTGYTSAPTVVISAPLGVVISPSVTATPPAAVSINTVGSGLNGNMTQGAGQFNASTTGTVATLNAGTGTTAGNITLGNTNFLTVGASGNNISITESSGLSLGAINAAGTLAVQIGTGNDLGSAGTITAGGLVTIQGRGVTLSGTGALTFASISATSTLSVNTTGDLTLNQAGTLSTSRSISLTSSGGKVTVTPNLTTSTLTLAAPTGTITTTGLLTAGTTAAATNGATSITASGDITLNGVTTRFNDGGNTTLTVTSTTGNISLGAISTASTLVATATAGNVTAGTMSTQTATLTASNGTVTTGTITSGNSFTASAGSVTTNNISIGNSSLNLTATTGTISTGNISTGTASSTLSAPSLSGSILTGSIVQANTTATFNMTSGGSINLGNGSALNTISVPVLNVTSTGGSITQSATITSTTRATFSAAGDILLENVGNNLNNVSLIGGASSTSGFRVVDSNALILGNGTNTTAAVTITSGAAGAAGDIQIGASATDSLTFGSSLTLLQGGAVGNTGNITTVANSVAVFGNVAVTTKSGNSATLGSSIFGNVANYRFGQVSGDVGAGTFKVYENTTLNLGNLKGSALEATSFAGDIINTGKLDFGTSSLFFAGTVFNPTNVSLTSANNILGGTVTIANAKDFTLTNSISTIVSAGAAGVNGKAATGTVFVTVTGSNANTLTLTTTPGTGGDYNVVGFNAPGAVSIIDPNGLTLQNATNSISNGNAAVNVSASGPIVLGSGIALGGNGVTTFTSNFTTTTPTPGITDSAAGIRIFGEVTFNSAGNIALTNAGHSFGAVNLVTTAAATAGTVPAPATGTMGLQNVTFTEGGTLVLKNVSVGNATYPGSLTLTSTGGSIVQAAGGTIVVPSVSGANPATFTSATGGVVLSNTGNRIETLLNISAVGNSSYTQTLLTPNLYLGNIVVTGGTLTIDASGAAGQKISQWTGTTIKSYGNPTFLTAAGAINLTNTGNNFGGVTARSNVLNSGLATATVAGAAVTGITSTLIGTGYAASTTVPVTLTGGGGAGATAVANTDAGGTIISYTITAPGAGYTSAPTVAIAATPVVPNAAAPALAGADIAISETGVLNLVSVNTGVGGKFAATSEAASIIQSGTGGVLVGGSTTLTAATGVTLNTVTTNNTFGGLAGILIKTDGNVSIQDANAITALANGTNVGGTLTLKNTFAAGGEIRDLPGTNPITVGGNVLLDTGITYNVLTDVGARINLGSSTLSLGAIQFRSGKVTIVENTTLNLAAGSSASGPVSLTSSGNIITTGAGGSSFNNTLALNASGNITISNPIFVSGSGGTSPSGLTFRALGAVDLSALSLAGNLNGIAPTNLGASSYKAPTP